jgi:hypothetical protein
LLDFESPEVENVMMEPTKIAKSGADIKAQKQQQTTTSRFVNLSEKELQKILKDKHSDKTKKTTNWSVSTFKGKNNYFNFLLKGRLVLPYIFLSHYNKKM